jgi:hypothetical protein
MAAQGDSAERILLAHRLSACKRKIVLSGLEAGTVW